MRTTVVFVRMVLNEPLPPEIHDLLARRRALGQDHFDEVWNGEYHMSPAPHGRHGLAEMEINAILRPHALDAGLHPIGQFNIGHSDNYRVPDGGYLRTPSVQVFFGTAAILVEILSPGDETFEKFDHYAEHGVEEIIVVDPATKTVRCFDRRTDGMDFVECARSTLLAVAMTDVEQQMRWP